MGRFAVASLSLPRLGVAFALEVSPGFAGSCCHALRMPETRRSRQKPVWPVRRNPPHSRKHRRHGGSMGEVKTSGFLGFGVHSPLRQPPPKL